MSQRFAGVQNGQVNGKHFHQYDWDANSTFKFYHPRYDWFATETLQYSSNFTAQTSGPASETQSRNQFAVDGGSYLHLWHTHSKELPQFSAVLSGHLETQVGNPVTNVSLSPVPPSTKSSTLTFRQGRTELALARPGLRFQNRKSFIEGGLEGGQTLNAILAFRVFPSPAVTPVTCLLQASQSLSTCLNNYNKANPTAPVTPSSRVEVLRHPQPRLWHLLENWTNCALSSHPFVQFSGYE